MLPSDRPLASGRYAWYVVGVLTLANVSGFVDRQILSLLVPAIKRDLGISDTQMSYLIGLSFSVFYTVLGLPIAWWADRGNRRDIMAGGVTLWSLMTMACGIARTYGRLLLTRIGVGVGEASLSAPSVSLIADYFPRERLGTAMSVYQLGVFLGSGLAYFIGGWIVGLIAASGRWQWPIIGTIRPWQTVFFVVGAPGLFVAALMMTVREPRTRRRERSRPPERVGAGAIASGMSLDSGLVQPLDRRMRLLPYVRANRRTFFTHSFGFALSGMVNYGIAAWLATFLIRTYGWSVARAGMVQGILTMTIGVAGVLLGGRVADRLVRRGRVDAALRVGIIGAVGMLVSASAYPLMPSAGLAVAWLALVNFFAAFPWGAAAAAAAEIVPAPLRSQGAALYFFVLNLVSSALGPSVVAWITDYAFHDDGALRYSLVIVNVAGMLAAILLFAAGLPAYRRTLATRDAWDAA